MQFEEDEVRQSDEDPEFTGTATDDSVDDEFIDDDDIPVDEEGELLDEDEDEEDDEVAADL
ncbi:MAG: hypothetical protein WCG55_02330 [bacterium]